MTRSTNVQQVNLTVLNGSASDLDAYERRMRRFGRIFIVVFTCLGVGIFALTIGQFVHAWQSSAPHDWSDFSESIRDVLSVSPLIALPASIQKAVQYGRLALQARDAAIAGNNYLAPVSDEQPEPLSGFELSSLSATLGPIRVPVSQRRVALILLLFCFLASAALAIAIVAVLLLSLPISDSARAFIIALVLCVWVILILGAFILGLRSAHTFVRVDDWEIAWGRRRDDRRRIAWSEAQAFFKVDHNADLRPHTSYVLAGQGKAFIWDAHRHANTEEAAAVEQLNRLIVTRTKLPLRDLTGFAVSVQQAEATTIASVTAPASAEETHGALPTTTASSKPRGSRAGCIFSIACVLAPLVLGGLGWGAQRYQEHIASNLVTQVHAQPFLFADPLNMDSGNWPIEQARDNTYQEHYYFQGGAYHMQGVARDRIMYAWGSPSYANVAVEATVSEHGSDPDDGVGLLLRADESGDKYVAFMVDKTGDWYLLDFTYKSGDPDDNWSTIAGSDDDQAVHSGEGATNRLLVIIRGNRFTCFVNDHLIGSFAVSGVPVVGHMGVYSNASDVEGVYTNFVVYPAPPVPIPFA